MPIPTLETVKDRQSSQDRASKRTASGDEKLFAKRILQTCAVASLIVGFAPFAFICWLIVSTGANNICVDYAAFLHVVDKILSGQYQWLSIFSDSFIRTHMVLFPVLVHTAIAYATHWDVTSELYVGMAFHLTRAFLLADLLAGRIANKWMRIAITGAVAAMVFAMSQTCIMIYGEASIAIGLSLLGFTFALWALCKFGRTPRGLALMLAGGVLSCYSFGNVVPCWVTLLLAVFLLPARGWAQHWDAKKGNSIRPTSTSEAEWGGLFVNRKVAVAYWLIGTVVSLVPYFVFLAQRAPRNPELTKTFGFLHPVFVINALGRPFARDMGLDYGRLPGAEISAAILLLIVVALAVPMLLSRLRACNTTKVCSLLFAYGFVSVWSVGVFRTHIAPWYATMSMYCWIAVFGVCAANLWRLSAEQLATPRRIRVAIAWTSCVGIVAIVVLYLITNLSYRDKQFFLNARAPVSAEYLRNYKTAPTYLESTIFSNDGRPDRIISFANSLSKHDLCVFGPIQTWSLQGQFALANVSIERMPGSKHVMWLDGRNSKRRTSWRDYHHLNLAVPDGNVVEWRFDVPLNASEAIFNTSVCSFSDPAGGCAAIPARVVSNISVVSGAPDTVSEVRLKNSIPTSGSASYVTCCDDSWKPVHLNLLQYRGRSVTIRLASQAQGDLYSGLCDDKNCIPSSVLYSYPHVNISLDVPTGAASAPVVLRPSNTDLSPDFPRTYTHRMDLPPVDSANWKPVKLGLPEDKAASLEARYWVVPQNKRLSPDEFDYLMMQLEPLPGKAWCSIKMHLQFDDGTTDGFSIPLMPDNQSHCYVYPVKLLTAKSGARLAAVMTYASAVDVNTLPGKATTSTTEKLPSTAISGSQLSNCISVGNLAFIKSVATLKNASSH